MMATMGRRIFLFGAFADTNGVAVQDNAARAVSVAPAQEQGRSNEPAIFKIGKIADFPVGSEKLLGSATLLVQSLSEGLRARSNPEGQIYYALFANQTGELSVNRNITWPADMVFSIMTGEPTRLCTKLEERT